VIVCGGGLVHDCGTSRAMGWFLEPLVVLGLWAKKVRQGRGGGAGGRKCEGVGPVWVCVGAGVGRRGRGGWSCWGVLFACGHRLNVGGRTGAGPVGKKGGRGRQ
jgi:hypothetical protein